MSAVVFERLTQFVESGITGEKWRLMIAGNCLRLIEALGVDVSILRKGQIVGKMKNCKSGDYLRDFDFDGIEIEQADGSYQHFVTIEISSSGAGSERVIGDMRVTNEILTVENLVNYVSKGYRSSINMASNQVSEALKGIDNAYGAKIKRASIMTMGANWTGGIELFAWNSNGNNFLPSITDLENSGISLLNTDSVIFTGSVWVGSGKLEADLHLEPNWGLYFISRQTETRALRTVIYA